MDNSYRDERGLMKLAAFTPEEALANQEYETSPGVEAQLRRAIIDQTDPKKKAILEDSYRQDFGRPSGVAVEMGALSLSKPTEAPRINMSNVFASIDSGKPVRAASADPAGPYDLSRVFAAIDKDTTPKKAPGFWSDTGTLLKTGVKHLAADVTGVLGAIPGVKDIPNVTGEGSMLRTAEDYWAHSAKEDQKSLSPEMQQAMEKKWWDNGPGEALTDWRSWYSGALVSMPETLASMVPALRVAKGAAAVAEARAMANAASMGLSAAAAREAVAKAGSSAAAKAAFLTGALTEGSMGGAQSAREVRDTILNLKPDVLAQSQAYQSLISQGMSDADARRQLSEDAGTKAFVLGGIATGLFSGAGDVMLSKMFRGEIKGGLLRKVGVGMVSEGLLEEAPQGSLQQIAHNYTQQAANPVQDLYEGVANQAVGGAAIGGLMGGGMGVVGHTFGKEPAAPSALETGGPAGTPPGSPTPPAGLLGYSANAPLVVFPDGSTMTGAEAERERFRRMVQPADAGAAHPAFNPNPQNDIATERTAAAALADAGKLEAELQPGDKLKKDGTPFKTQTIAALVMKKNGLPENWAVVPVTGGFVIREMSAAADALPTSEPQPAAPVAESLAPVPSEPGDAGVAPGQGGAAADIRDSQTANEASAPLDVTHASTAAMNDPRNSAIRDGWNAANFTTGADGQVARVKHDHFSTWFEGGGVTGEIGSQYDAHGIAKGNPLGALLNLLQNGISQTRRFDSAPLATMAGQDSSGLGSASGAYKDGPFIVLGARGKSITDGIKTVLVSDSVASIIPSLKARFPEINFVPYSQAQAELSKQETANAPGPTTQAGQEAARLKAFVDAKMGAAPNETRRPVPATAGPAFDAASLAPKKVAGTPVADIPTAKLEEIAVAPDVHPNTRQAAQAALLVRQQEEAAPAPAAALPDQKGAPNGQAEKAGEAAQEVLTPSVAADIEKMKAATKKRKDGKAADVDQLQKDQERIDAERRAVDMGANAGKVSVMSDAELRSELLRQARKPSTESPAKRATLNAISSRLELNGDALDKHLEAAGIEVADDGMLEIERITKDAEKIAGDLPVAFYHHTSSALLPAIEREGLKIGKQTNFFNTQAGVYVSTIRAGVPVETYSKRAAKVYGGEPTTIRLKRRLSQVKPDPDDADLAWAQGRQFVTPGVPVSDLLFDDLATKPEPKTAAGKEAKKLAKKTKDPLEAVREFYTPGNIIHVDYWNQNDKVLEFKEGPERGQWSVKVQQVKKQDDGTWKAVDDPRWHSTAPDKDTIVDRVAPESKATPADVAPESKTTPQDADLGSMFDEVLAEEKAKDDAPKTQAGAEAKRLAKKPVTPQVAAPAGSTPLGAKLGPKKPRTAGAAAASAALNTGKGLQDAISGLGKLFGGTPGTLGSGPVFNEDTYAQALPLFKSAIAHFKDAGADIKEAMRSVVRMVMDQFGTNVVENMKPYVVRFAEDVRSGKVVYDVSKEAVNHERSGSGEQGPQALGDMAPAANGDAEGGGKLPSGNASSGSDGAGREGPPDAAGLPGPRSGGSRSPSVHPVEAGTGLGGATGSGKRTRRKGSRVPAEPAGSLELDLSPANNAPSTPNIPAANFSITGDVRLGQGGEAEKFRDNLAAVRILKEIEQANRRATPEEQRALARYVGWGGLANAFAAPDGTFKDGWEAKGKELAGLLTKPELDAARRSTRNAHYTSQTIVNTIWDAARQLGFKGGLTLEPSAGTGNFIGLLPEALQGATKFIGVEYDSLTARIAQALYPQATILHSPFQKVPLADNAFDLVVGNPPFGAESLRFQFKPELNGLSIHNQFFLASLDAVKPGGLQIMVVSRYLMDAQDNTARTALAGKARLLGAIRLPDTAFKENAKTDVVTDILFLQRLTAQEEEAVSAIWKATGKDGEGAIVAPENWYGGWTETRSIPDPMGGEAMTVNAYFAQHPEMVVGRLERSGTMQFGGRDEEGKRKLGVNVKLGAGQDYATALREAVAKLPRDVMTQTPDAVAASLERYKTMSESLMVAISGKEAGHVAVTKEGTLEQIIDRETPEGDFELTSRPLTPASPWSRSLYLAADGKWYQLETQKDAEGKPVKQVGKDGKPTKRNVYERQVFDRVEDIPAGMLLGEAKYERLMALTKLRDLFVTQLYLEATDSPSSQMEANRAKLAEAYHAFVAKYEHISKDSNASLVADMPDGALVRALELSYRPEITPERARKIGEQPRAASAEEAPILTRRVVPVYAPPTSAATPSDALAITTAERGRVDMSRIAGLLGVTEDEAAARLQEGEKPLVFMDPETQTWETADAYLSGQVKKKLNAAIAAGLDKNVVALEKVQPETWSAEHVTATIGATWVPGRVYADFIRHLTGNDATVSFAPVTNSFAVVGDSSGGKATDWNTEGYRAHELVSDMLNSRPIKVTWTDSDGKTHVNQEATTLAEIKAKQIAAEFADWVFAEGSRRAQLVEIFNEKFNTRVNRQFDGSHLKLPGKVPDEIIAMRRHQNNTIWRGISQRFMLVDHVVGAGKTFTAIARAMERRRMGLSKKPTIVVPNHLVEQWAADVYRLYPGAKVLAAGTKDFEKSRRRRLFAKIASGDWDIVILPHSSFGFIGISPETEGRFLDEELRKALQAIKDAEEEAELLGLTGGRRKPFNVKEAERLAESIQARIDKLSDRAKDKLLTFEQMGIDDLTIDEAHEFKNLFFSSRLANVRGMGNKSGSQKAFDLYNKVRVLSESPTGTVTFMTGTPISNSAVEMYTMMRYLAPSELRDLGLEHFDAWRAQSVDVDSKFEPTESGKLKEVNRMGRTWSNMRALMDLYYSFTDAVTQEDIQKWYREDNSGAEYPIPKVEGGSRQKVVVKPSPAQIEILNEVLSGFDNLKNIDDPYERNAARLRLMDRARKVSLDARAVDPRNPSDEKGGKLETVAKEAYATYQKWNADKGTQLIFLDRSVPKAKGDDKIIKAYDALVMAQEKALREGNETAYRVATEALDGYNANEVEELRNAQHGGWNAYQQIKDNLVAMGIPAREIRFIQEATNDEQKKAMFDAVNAGEVRILIGSTQRMGAGTNVQQRLVALHHVDVTWKPSDIEQREGRIIRQGNKLLEKYGMDNFAVRILAYATERTVDAKMWDLNATKLRMVNGIRKYDGAFNMEFEDEEAVGMAELAALASGDPMLLERVKLMAELDRLELVARAHRRKMFGIAGRIEDAQKDIARIPGWMAANTRQAEALQPEFDAVDAEAKARRVTVNGKEFSSRFDAMKAAQDEIDRQKAGDENARYALMVDGRKVTNKADLEEAVSNALGDDAPFKAVIGGETFITRSAAVKAILAKVLPAVEKLNDGDAGVVELGTIFGRTLSADFSKKRDRTAVYSVMGLSLTNPDGSMLAGHDGGKVDGDTFAPAYVRSLLGKVLESAVNQVRGAESENRRLERQLADAKESLPGLLEQKGKPFPQQAEMDAKRARLEEVVRTLSAENKDGETVAAKESRGKPSTGMPREAVAMTVAPIVGKWKNAPRVSIVQSISEARTANPGLTIHDDAHGFYHNGAVTLIADNLPSKEMTEYVLLHEALGHAGLASLLREKLEPALRDIFQTNVKMQLWAAKWLKQDVASENQARIGAGRPIMTKEEERAWRRDRQLLAVEEVLANEAGTGNVRKLKGWDKLVAAVRSWARALGFTLDWTDNDVVNLLRRTREHIEGKGAAHFFTMNGDEGARFSQQPKFGPVDTESPEFRAWFGDSKVVDAEGKPLRVYHGSKEIFTAFDPAFAEREDNWSFSSDIDVARTYQPQNIDPAKVWEIYRELDSSDKKKFDKEFDSFLNEDGEVDRESVERWAEEANNDDPQLWAGDLADTVGRRASIFYGKADGQMVEAYLSLQNPIEYWYDSKGNIIKTVKPEGEHDGYIHHNAMDTNSPRNAWIKSTVYQVLTPTQIKSAITNTGAFSSTNPDIRFSRQSALMDSAYSTLDDAFRSHKTFNSWWHKTVGTQYHKATVDKDYERVFKLGQDYLGDVSRIALRPADLAPGILPKIENMKRAISGIVKGKKSAKDVDAIAEAVFVGTLNDKAYSVKELRDHGLSETQIALYHQFRDATNASLEELSASEAWKQARIVMDPALKESIVGDPRGARAAIVDGLDALISAEQDVDRLELLDNIKGSVTAIYQQLDRMKARGYAPLMRFGKYTVDVVELDPTTGEILKDHKGEEVRHYFSMFESEREANAMAKALREEYPGATVQQGVLSERAFEMFKGVSPESMELFAQAVGAEESEIFQKYLKLATNNRSAMKRLIRRKGKGIAGYSPDVTRVLAAFITSNARLASKNYHMGDMIKAVEAVPKAKGDVRDESVGLYQYLTNPQEEAAKLRGYLFMHYLGGSLASAVVNATQPLMMTAPYLTSLVSIPRAVAITAKATKLALSKTIDDSALAEALHTAEQEGIVAPQEIHHLYAEAMRQMGGGYRWRSFLTLWGTPFALAEAFNRRHAFISAWLAAKETGKSPYSTAVKAVHETQGIYNRGNRPDWARGPVGSVLMTFKQYSVAYVELFKRLPWKSRGVMLGILILMAGMQGLPGAEDLEDLIDTLLQALGYAANSKKWLRDQALDILGEEVGNYVLHGTSVLPGMPIDVQQRLGMQNLLPATALFKRSNKDKSQAAWDMLGPAGGLVKSALDASDALMRGDEMRAAKAVLPKAFGNLVQAYDMGDTGVYKDTRGNRVLDVDAADVLSKAIGFMPAQIGERSRLLQGVRDDIAIYSSMRQEFAERIAKGVVDKDPAAVSEARADLIAWNRDNPEMPIQIKDADILKKVVAAKMTRDQRFIKLSPPAMRGTIAKELAQ